MWQSIAVSVQVLLHLDPVDLIWLQKDHCLCDQHGDREMTLKSRITFLWLHTIAIS